jgi:AcrR family transcriptional regulator
MARAGRTTTQARPGRVEIMRTAIGLMGERGYEGTSTRDIAAAAGVSNAALYHHFPSKLELLRQFVKEAHDVVLARVARNIAAAGDDPREQLDTAVETLIASSLHDRWARRAAQVAWRETGRLDEPDRQAIAATRDQMTDLIEQVVAAGARTGVFRTGNPREAAQAVLTLCISVVDPYSASGKPMEDVIELHQRYAAALADTPSAPRRAR